MKRVLIVELDKNFAARLFQVLQDAGEYEVTSARTMREACLVLTQHPYDVAFIPAANHGNLIRSLRSLCPRLPLIAVTDRASASLPAAYDGEVEAVLPRPALGRDSVRAALARAAGEGALDAPPQIGTDDDGADIPLLMRLRSAGIPKKVLTCVFSEGQRVLAHHGTLDGGEVAEIARLTAASWKEGLSGQLQFVHLPTRMNALLLYSHALGDGRLLTVAAQPSAVITRLRAEAATLAATVAAPADPSESQTSAPRKAMPVVPPVPSRRKVPEDGPEGEQLFTISWRARSPLPDVLHVPLRRALKKIAVTHGCTLPALTISGEQIYLVIACPPDRDGDWAAKLLREGTERAIQEQFGVDAHMWEPAYLVRPGRHSLRQESEAHSTGR